MAVDRVFIIEYDNGKYFEYNEKWVGQVYATRVGAEHCLRSIGFAPTKECEDVYRLIEYVETEVTDVMEARIVERMVSEGGDKVWALQNG